MSRFAWRKSGRRYVANVGPLTIEVDTKGRKDDGTKQYRASTAFGKWLSSTSCPWRFRLAEALTDAEREAIRIALQFNAALIRGGLS